jgi:hypothetical protein
VLFLLSLGLFGAWDAQAQSRSATPLSGHYPGGHTGLMAGATPPEGLGFFTFNKLSYPGNVKDANGNTIAATNKTVNASISGIAWNSDYKIGGMTWGGVVAIVFNDVYNRPTGQSGSSSGYGLGDIVIAPFALYGVSQHFDYQVGVGAFAPTGAFTPGSSNNHGSGFWTMLGTLGGAYYPDGNRKSFNLSAVLRIEQNFQQRHTGINPGDDVVMDWGIGSPLLPLDETHKHIVRLGVTGFATTQFTRETGSNAALNTSFYRVFALGPEFNYFYPDWKLKFLFRPQWEFDARNTTEGMTYWFAISHSFGHI